MRRLNRRVANPLRHSARGRIVGWLVLLVALALVAMTVVVGRLVLTRADTGLSRELAHEADKLRTFAERGADPATGRPFTNSGELLESFLQYNVAEGDETFFSVVAGRADSRSASTPLERVDLNQELVATAAAAAASRTTVSGTVATTAGPARYAVLPVQVGDDAPAALVAVEFAGPARQQAWSVIQTLALVGAATLAAAAFGGWVVAGQVLWPIRLVRQTARQISESDLSRRIDVSGDDEVASLARTFNQMLDRIQDAFHGQRQFMDDASHELRTPLTVVRGHIELMGDDPAERAQTRALVLAELDRMTRMVDDLMLLARAERPDFVQPAEVDLADLIVEVVAKARPLGSRRWVIDELAETTIRGDVQRLTQALLQLAANAVQHSGDGDEIGLGSQVSGEQARLWVRDNGDGIPDADHERIFDRAERGHSAGRSSVSSSGLGLGLTIVTRIAQAHGGRVELSSAVGVGSRFTLVLPVPATEGSEVPQP